MNFKSKLIRVVPKRFIPISYVVVATPRSGTGFISEVLKNLGLSCGHERFYGPQRAKPGMHVRNPFKKEYWYGKRNTLGDSSWLAVPFLSELPKGSTIIHQVRDPLKSLNSMIHTQCLDWDQDIDPDQKMYAEFIFNHMKDHKWPKDPLGRAQLFWVKWHKMILKETKRSNYLFSRVEDIDRQFVRSVIASIGKKDVTDTDIDRAITSVDVKFNRKRGKPMNYVESCELSSEFIELAKHFGYQI